jgi:hypothetical protein
MSCNQAYLSVRARHRVCRSGRKFRAPCQSAVLDFLWENLYSQPHSASTLVPIMVAGTGHGRDLVRLYDVPSLENRLVVDN